MRQAGRGQPAETKPVQSVKPAPPTADRSDRNRDAADRGAAAGRQLLHLSTDGKRLYFMSSEVSATGPSVAEDAADREQESRSPKRSATDVTALRAVARSQEAPACARARISSSSTCGAKAPQRHRRRTRCRSTDWAFRLDPRDEWRQMFTEAWRLERDYFYDRGMHGVDWPAMQGEVPAAGRARDRSRGAAATCSRRWSASCRRCTSSCAAATAAAAPTRCTPASLGATFTRDEQAGGYRVRAHLQVRSGHPRRARRRWRVSTSTSRKGTSSSQ